MQAKTKTLLYSCLTTVIAVAVFATAALLRPHTTPISKVPVHEQPTSVAKIATSTPTPAPTISKTATKPALASAPTHIASVTPVGQNPLFTTTSGQTYPLRKYKTTSVNDPYGNQWWTSGTGLDSAWSIGAGARQTTVAVIDTGFALNHEELSGRWAVNSGEQGSTTKQNSSKHNCTDRGLALDKSCNLIDDDHNGVVDDESGPTTVENPSQLNCTDKGLALDKACNLVDDDSNGYVDDVTGWDFANGDPSVQAGQTNPSGSSTTHGTETTGVLAATGNNSKGIAGVNWQTKILPIQAIDDNGNGDTLTVGTGIYYAADRGADVISLSLGSTLSDPYVRQAVQYALSKGSIVVAAAGNDGCNCMLYPANYPEVFAVGANNSSNQRSSFSSYGANLDILAPGESITTTAWSAANPTNTYVSGAAGTSFATPYVSGLLSLARSHQPNATWGELTNTLLAAANHTGLSAGNPFSSQIGSGYAQAGTYLARVTTPAQPGMRYQFDTSSKSGILGSSHVYDCTAENSFPTAPFYAVTLGGATFYTIDPVEEINAVNAGGSMRSLGYACVGLPGDTPTTLRSINLSGEIANQPGGKYSY
jgi:subtilisin family serine protease